MKHLWLATLSLVCASSAHAFTCADAQKIVLNLPQATLDSLSISTVDYEDTASFVQSKPLVSSAELITRSYVSTEGPYEQLWCKLKSQEAVSSTLKVTALGSPHACALVQEQVLEAALQEHYGTETAHPSLKDLGISLLEDKDFKTGSQWAPSQLIVKKTASGVELQATRLTSPTWVPVFGGMNYCKTISPQGARQLIAEASAQHEETPFNSYQTQRVEWQLGGIFGKQSALFYFKDSIESTISKAKGIYIISPGGEIPATAMSGLAEALSDKGFATFIVQYPKDLAILDTVSGRGNAALNLAERLKHHPESIQSVDFSSLQPLAIHLFGHSLGGATLGSEVIKPLEQSSVAQIVLYGTAQFVKMPGQTPLSHRPLALLFGEHDGLSHGSIPGFLKNYGLSYQADDFSPHASPDEAAIVYQQLKGLNHFCIISDQNVGNPSIKKKDGTGPAPQLCLEQLLGTMEQLGFL